MSKDIAFGKEAFDKMLKGIDTAADAVSGTMGPKGRNVYLDDPIQPKIVNDGATVANHVHMKDKQEDAGSYVIRNISSQQLDDVGDGTTTVTVLTQSIIHEALKRPENPMEVKQSLKEAGDKVLKILAKKSIKLDKKDIEKVALISSEDTHIAKLITEITNKLGEKAVINVEDSKTFATDYEIVDGYEAHVGFMSPHFITDKKSNRAIYENIPVIVSEKKLSNLTDIAPIFEMFKQENIGSCVIVAADIDDSILGILVQNKLMGTFNSLVIRANGWLLQDIEGATGAKAISDSTGVTFKNFTKDHLGTVSRVVSDSNKTIFTTDGVASKKYAGLLEMQAENEPNQYQAKQLQKRADKMRGGVAVLRIGASTDFERDYLRLKAEDSVKSVQAALEEGVVEGGGMALWRIAQGLKAETIGEQILKKALQAPLRKIIENAGKDYTEIIGRFHENSDNPLYAISGTDFNKDSMEKITTQLKRGGVIMPLKNNGKIERIDVNDPMAGYDAKNDKVTNLIEAGIIDPTKVERCAVENAVSSASTFITTFCVIVEAEEEKK